MTADGPGDHLAGERRHAVDGQARPALALPVLLDLLRPLLAEAREALVVDPHLDIQPYIDLASERDYTIVDVIDTHLHADHISGNRALVAATGARLWLHEAADVHFPFNALRDGQDLRLGQLIIHVVYTPGHRPESVCLLVTNPPRSPEPSLILSGDTLFVGDVGRPDFGGPEGARTQYASIQLLLKLEDYIEEPIEPIDLPAGVSGGATQKMSVLAIGFAASPVPNTSRMTPPSPVFDPP